MHAIPAQPMALPQAISPNATRVAFGHSNTMPTTTRKKHSTKHNTRPQTNSPSYHDQDSNYELYILYKLDHIIYHLY